MTGERYKKFPSFVNVIVLDMGASYMDVFT